MHDALRAIQAREVESGKFSDGTEDNRLKASEIECTFPCFRKSSVLSR
jgi:hypothetical protein